MDPNTQLNFTKLSPAANTSKDELSINTIDQRFAAEFEIPDGMTAALRRLERICAINNLNPAEQVQFGIERQVIHLNKWMKRKKDREERACTPGFSERSWLRAMRNLKKQGT